MSQFMAQELLFDYVNGNLDSARQQAVEQAIADYPDLVKELELINAANDYCDKLSETTVHEELVVSLFNIKSISKTVISKLAWKQWPDALKWTTEAIVLSSMVIAFTMVAPWEDIKSWIDFDNIQAEVTEPVVEKELAKAEPKVVKAADVEKNIEKPKVVNVPAKAVAAKPTLEPTAAPTPTQAPLKGTLFRMSMKVSNIEGRANEIKDIIVGLGGEKAGRVRLGWRRKNGNYYHFSLPNKNMQQLSNTLGEYGPVRLSKYPHSRVMPDGVNRIILFIEDGPVEETPAVSAEAEPLSNTPVEASPAEKEEETTPPESDPEAPVDEQGEEET